MAEKVVIDVEARFKDGMSPQIDNAIKKAEKLEKKAKKISDALSKIDKSSKQASIGLKDKATPILEKISNKMKGFIGQKKWDFIVGVKDKASAGLSKISAKLKGVIGQKKWDYLVGLKDRASPSLQKIITKLRSINKEKIAIRISVAENVFKRLSDITAKLKGMSSNAWKLVVGMSDKATNGLSKIKGVAKALVTTPYKVTVSLVDKVTAPLRKIQSGLTSVAGMVGVGLGMAGVSQTVGMYADREDLMAQFKVLLGSQKSAEKRISELVTFAGQTPFTRDQIFQASKMLETYTSGALSSPDSPGGLRTVGDIAAATGADYGSVAMYMGRLYNEVGRGGEALGEPLMLLREIGAVSADAEKRITEIAQGSGTLEEKWAQIAAEFTRFDGMMLEMSNQMNNLLLGVKSFISNNFLMKMGEGISSQLKPFLIDFRTWRNENSDVIAGWAASVENFSAVLSGKFLGVVRKIASTSFELFSSDDFKAASMAGKFGMIWNNIIAKPLSEWWGGRGQGLFESKARSMGEFLGEGITKGLTAIFSGDFSTALTSLFPVGGTFLQGLFGKLDANEILSSFQDFVDNIPEAFKNIKLKWDEYIGAPLKAWWESGGRDMFTELASNVGDWLGTGITKGVQFLSDGILGILGIKDSDGIVGEAASIGKSFWDSFTDAFDGEAITKAIVDAISGVWSALPTWAKFLVGGMAVSKAASFLAPIMNLAGGLGNIGKGVAAGFGNTAKGVGTVGSGLGQGASLSYYVGSGLSNLGTKAYTLLGGVGTKGIAGKLLGGTALTGGTAALAGLGAVAGGATAAYGLYDAGTDLYSAYKANKKGDTTTRDYNLKTGVSKLGGTGLGAAIGTAIAPGVGTLIGAGLGYVGGKLFGDTWARSARAAKVESEEMKAAIKDSSKSAEELAYEFERAKEKNLAKHFGEMELSMEEISDLSKKLVRGDRSEYFEKMATASQQAQASIKNYNAAVSDLDRWDWKASLGVKFNDEDKTEIMSAVDTLINSAKQAVEDQHYEFSCAVGLIFAEDSETKQGIIETGNAFFEEITSKLEEKSENIKIKYKAALEDGIITPDEAKVLSDLQAEINKLTTLLNNAEKKARLSALEVEFDGVKLTSESFTSLLEQLQADIEADKENLRESHIQIMTVLEAQYELETDPTKKEEIKAQMEEEKAAYKESLDGLYDDPMEFAIRTIANAYPELGDNGFDKIQTLLNECYSSGENPLDLTLDDIRVKLGAPNLSDEDAGNIQDFLGKIQNLFPSTVEEDVGVDVSADAKVTNGEDLANNVKNEVISKLPTNLFGEDDFTMPVAVTPECQFSTPVQSAFQMTLPQYLTGSTSGKVNVASTYNRDPEEMDIPDGTLDTSTAADVGVSITYYTSSSNLTAYKASLASFSGSTGKSAGDNKPKRGSANREATGGFVKGMQLTWVAEEGPEAIIPLVQSRRPRALDLWAETGRRLGVLENANGGIYNGYSGRDVSGSENNSGGNNTGFVPFVSGGEGGSDETPSPQVTISGDSNNDIQVNVGGITIQVNGGDGNVVNAIKENIEEITEEVAGILQNALAANFKNMPARS